jgi:Tfp pilus assembly protein PilF
MRRIAPLLLLAALACKASDPPAPAPTSPYQEQTEADRQTAQAERLSRQAADLIVSDQAQAEVLLREALGKDLYYGPAHNNLGVLFLKQSKLYEAAGEFEWARKLMPGHPDPRVNLAIVLEKAGKNDDALASYGAALEVYPAYLPAIEGLACLTLKSGRSDPRMRTWLETISMQSESPQWAIWARAQMTHAR